MTKPHTGEVSWPMNCTFELRQRAEADFVHIAVDFADGQRQVLVLLVSPVETLVPVLALAVQSSPHPASPAEAAVTAISRTLM